MNDILYSHKSDAWETPQDLYEALNKEFHFTLDAASTDQNAKCDKHYTIQDDGLAQSWIGETVWCNPPYSNIKAWAAKALEEKLNGVTTVMLVPSRTDTAWFHDFVYHNAELRFIRGRLRFGDATHNAPFPSMICIFRSQYEA